MLIGKVWIYRLLFVCFFLCLFVRLVGLRLRISPPRIKVAASYFARRFIGVQGRECPIFGNFVFPEAQNRTSRLPPGSIALGCVSLPHRKRHARPTDAPFVEYRAACGCRSACVDIRPSLKTDVLVCNFVCLYGYRYLRRGSRDQDGGDGGLRHKY